MATTKQEKAKLKRLRKKENLQKRKSKKRQEMTLRKLGLKYIRKTGRGGKRGELKLKKSKGRKRGNIEAIFEKGVYKIVIKDMKAENESEINKNYRNLFKGVEKMYGKELMNVLIQEENIQKIKFRFETKLRLIDMNGKVLGELKCGSGGDLQDMKKISNYMKEGMEVYNGGIRNYNYAMQEKMGYKFTFEKKGNIKRIEGEVIFRKG